MAAHAAEALVRTLRFPAGNADLTHQRLGKDSSLAGRQDRGHGSERGRDFFLFDLVNPDHFPDRGLHLRFLEPFSKIGAQENFVLSVVKLNIF